MRIPKNLGGARSKEVALKHRKKAKIEVKRVRKQERDDER